MIECPADIGLAALIAFCAFAIFVPMIRAKCWHCGSTADHLPLAEAAYQAVVGHRVLCKRCYQHPAARKQV
jgi:hypothetical protein